MVRSRRELEQLHVATFAAYADVLSRDDANAKAVDIGDVPQVEQELEASLVDEIIHAGAQLRRAIAKDDASRDLQDRDVSDPSFGDPRRHTDFHAAPTSCGGSKPERNYTPAQQVPAQFGGHRRIQQTFWTGNPSQVKLEGSTDVYLQ